MKSFKGSYWLTSGFYSFGSRLSVLFFGFGSFYLLIRYFPKPEFGIWALFLTITTIIEMSRSGLIQNALIKHLHSSSPADADKVVTASWLINVCFSVFIYVALFALSGLLGDVFESPELTTMFRYYGITILFLIPFSQFNYIQQAHFSFSGIFYSTITRQGLFFVAIVIIYFSAVSVSLPMLVLLHAGCTFMGLIMAFVMSRKFLTHRFHYDTVIVSKAFHFGKYVMGTNIASLLFKSTDQLAIGIFLTPYAVAAYNAAMRLSNLIEYPATSVAEIVYPKSTARIEKEGEGVVKPIYEKSVALILTITVPIVIVTCAFSYPIIEIIAGENYKEAASLLQITILFGFFTAFNRQFGSMMDSSGRPHINFKMLLFSLFFNIISNVVFIYFFGLIGAALGTLLSYVVIFVVNNYLLRKYFDIELRAVVSNMFMFYKMAFQKIYAYVTSKVS